MKKAVMLFVLLTSIVSASAATVGFQWVNGDISQSQYGLITCEREKRQGASNAIKDRICCINTDRNPFCGNNEPLLGKCEANTCFWPSPSKSVGYSMRYKSTPCAGLAIIAGTEYDAALTEEGCTKLDGYWCCSPFAFPPQDTGLRAPEPVPRKTESPTGALLIIDKSKWKAVQLGQLYWLKYEKRAVDFEKERCANGGGEIKIVDSKYGSYFYDKRNLQPGTRAFYMLPDRVIPLITWCEN